MRVLFAAVLAFASGCGGVPSFASSTFDANADGWTLNGDADGKADLRGVGGNPDGHICGSDGNTGEIWYFVAPSKYLGDASSAFGKRLTWDLKQDNLYQQIFGRDVVLTGNGLAVIFNIKATPGKEWTPYEAHLDGNSGWKVDEAPAFPAATEEQMRTVLRNITGMRIRGEFVDGPDTACLDNVFLGIK